MKTLARKTLQRISRPLVIGNIAQRIVNHHRNENNANIASNGELAFIENHKKDFNVVFDVGANIGEWTTLISAVSPKASIFAFEPSAHTFESLKKNCSTLKNVRLENIGLGDANEQKSFYIYGEDSVLNSAIKRDNIQQEKTETVIFKTLDTFCKENDINHISFLKIDTEGNEVYVLRGAEDMIKKGAVDYIQFEYGGTYISSHLLLKDIYEFFKDKPYKIYKLMANGIASRAEYKEEYENYQYANYVAIKK